MNQKPKKYPSQMAPNIVVRFPEGMKEQLTEIAKGNVRSLNSEIIDRLGKSLYSNVLHEGFLKINENGGADYTTIKEAPVSYENILIEYFRRMPEEKRVALLELLRP